MINQEIVRIALSYVGQEEISGNAGFKQEDFQNKMEAVGWDTGQAWCAYFSELIWKEAFKDQPQILTELNTLFSGSAVKTWKNFVNSPWKTTKNPEIGSVVIWQYYKNGIPDWTGHAGILIKDIRSTNFTSVEGNTNDKGGREGYIVAEKTRRYDFTIPTGLRLLGFINPHK